MGIRLKCPNGHQLHVKAFLAGKRGICPECNAKFTIPTTGSDPPGPPHEAPADDSELAVAVELAEPGLAPQSDGLSSMSDLVQQPIATGLGQHALLRRRRRDRAQLITTVLGGLVILLLIAVVLVVSR